MREKASRISPVGRAVTTPTPDHGDPGEGFGDERGPASAPAGCPAPSGCCSPASATVSSAGGTPWPAGDADPRPAMARVASARSPVRASSIIPSNRPRMETPRRCASASTQARRSWSSRIPTTVDLEVAMTSLTVIRGVYSSGAERWQAGGGRRARHRFQIGSGTLRRPGEVISFSGRSVSPQALHERGDPLDAPGLEARGTARGKALEDSDGVGASGSVTPRRPTLRTCSRRLACGPGTHFLGGLADRPCDHRRGARRSVPPNILIIGVLTVAMPGVNEGPRKGVPGSVGYPTRPSAPEGPQWEGPGRSTTNARTGPSMPRSDAGSSGRTTHSSGRSSSATASVTTTSPGAPTLTRRERRFTSGPK